MALSLRSLAAELGDRLRTMRRVPAPESSETGGDLQSISEREERILQGAAHATSFFMGEADVHRALLKIARTLDEDGIPYALVGAMALNEHGYRRVTVDVDILLTKEGLQSFQAKHLGRGYLEKFPGSRGVRDTENGVVIDVVLTGDYPGDGRPKPIAFPDPGKVAVRGDRIAVLPLPRLLELKLASGMTAPHRLKDLADVLEVIRVLGLPTAFANDLDPFVRDKYLELWQAAQGAGPE